MVVREELIIEASILNQVSSEARRIRADIAKLGTAGERSFRQISKSSEIAGISVGNLARRLSPVAALFAAGLGVRRITSDLSDFSRGMAEVSTIVDTTTTDIRGLSEAVLDLAVAQGENEAVLARGLYNTISAGISDTSEALTFLDRVSRFATASLTDQGEAVRLVSSTINAYGLGVEEAERVTDVFFKTIELGQTRGSELAASFGQVVTIADAVGASVEEVAAAVATLTKSGLATSEAVTALRSLLTAFAKKQEEANKTLGAGQQVFTDTAIRTKGLADAISDLVEAANGSQSTLNRLVGRVEGVNAALILGGKNADGFAEALEGIEGAAGSVATAVAKIRDEPFRKLDESVNRLRVNLVKFANETQFFDRLAVAVARISGQGAEFEVQTNLEQIENQLRALPLGVEQLIGTISVGLDEVGREAGQRIVSGIEQAGDSLAGTVFVDAARKALAALEAFEGAEGDEQIRLLAEELEKLVPNLDAVIARRPELEEIANLRILRGGFGAAGAGFGAQQAIPAPIEVKLERLSREELVSVVLEGLGERAIELPVQVDLEEQADAAQRVEKAIRTADDLLRRGLVQEAGSQLLSDLEAIPDILQRQDTVLPVDVELGSVPELAATILNARTRSDFDPVEIPLEFDLGDQREVIGQVGEQIERVLGFQVSNGEVQPVSVPYTADATEYEATLARLEEETKRFADAAQEITLEPAPVRADTFATIAQELSDASLEGLAAQERAIDRLIGKERDRLNEARTRGELDADQRAELGLQLQDLEDILRVRVRSREAAKEGAEAEREAREELQASLRALQERETILAETVQLENQLLRGYEAEEAAIRESARAEQASQEILLEQGRITRQLFDERSRLIQANLQQQLEELRLVELIENARIRENQVLESRGRQISATIRPEQAALEAITERARAAREAARIQADAEAGYASALGETFREIERVRDAELARFAASESGLSMLARAQRDLASSLTEAFESRITLGIDILDDDATIRAKVEALAERISSDQGLVFELPIQIAGEALDTQVVEFQARAIDQLSAALERGEISAREFDAALANLPVIARQLRNDLLATGEAFQIAFSAELQGQVESFFNQFERGRRVAEIAFGGIREGFRETVRTAILDAENLSQRIREIFANVAVDLVVELAEGAIVNLFSSVPDLFNEADAAASAAAAAGQLVQGGTQAGSILISAGSTVASAMIAGATSAAAILEGAQIAGTIGNAVGGAGAAATPARYGGVFQGRVGRTVTQAQLGRVVRRRSLIEVAEIPGLEEAVIPLRDGEVPVSFPDNLGPIELRAPSEGARRAQEAETLQIDVQFPPIPERIQLETPPAQVEFAGELEAIPVEEMGRVELETPRPIPIETIEPIQVEDIGPVQVVAPDIEALAVEVGDLEIAPVEVQLPPEAREQIQDREVSEPAAVEVAVPELGPVVIERPPFEEAPEFEVTVRSPEARRSPFGDSAEPPQLSVPPLVGEIEVPDLPELRVEPLEVPEIRLEVPEVRVPVVEGRSAQTQERIGQQETGLRVPLEVERDPLPVEKIIVPAVEVDADIRVEGLGEIDAPEIPPLVVGDIPTLEVAPTLPLRVEDQEPLDVDRPGVVRVELAPFDDPEVVEPDPLAVQTPTLSVDAPVLGVEEPPPLVVELDVPALEAPEADPVPVEAPESLAVEAPILEVDEPRLEVQVPPVEVEVEPVRVVDPELELAVPPIEPLEVVVPEVRVDAPDVSVDLPPLEAPEVDAVRVDAPAELDVDAPLLAVDAPTLEVEEPEVQVTVEPVRVVDPELEVEVPPLEAPEITIPDVEVDVPAVELQVPDLEVRVEEPENPVLEVPEIVVEDPVLEVPEIQVDVPSRVDVRIPPVPPLEVPPVEAPDLQVDAPTLRVDAPASIPVEEQFEPLTVDDPGLSLEVPPIELEPIDIDAPDIVLEAPDVDVPDAVVEVAPIEVVAPEEIPVDAPPVLQIEDPPVLEPRPFRLEIPDLALEAPDLELSQPDLELRAPEVDVPTVEVPQVDVDAPASIPVLEPEDGFRVDVPRVRVPDLEFPQPDPLTVEEFPTELEANIPAVELVAPEVDPVPVDAPERVPVEIVDPRPLEVAPQEDPLEVEAPQIAPLEAPEIGRLEVDVSDVPPLPVEQLEAPDLALRVPDELVDIAANAIVVEVEAPEAVPVEDVPPLEVALEAPDLPTLEAEPVEVNVDAPVLGVDVPPLVATVDIPRVEVEEIPAVDVAVPAPLGVETPTLEVAEVRPVPFEEPPRVEVELEAPAIPAIQVEPVEVDVDAPVLDVRVPPLVATVDIPRVDVEEAPPVDVALPEPLEVETPTLEVEELRPVPFAEVPLVEVDLEAPAIPPLDVDAPVLETQEPVLDVSVPPLIATVEVPRLRAPEAEPVEVLAPPFLEVRVPRIDAPVIETPELEPIPLIVDPLEVDEPVLSVDAPVLDTEDPIVRVRVRPIEVDDTPIPIERIDELDIDRRPIVLEVPEIPLLRVEDIPTVEVEAPDIPSQIIEVERAIPGSRTPAQEVSEAIERISSRDARLDRLAPPIPVELAEELGRRSRETQLVDSGSNRPIEITISPQLSVSVQALDARGVDQIIQEQFPAIERRLVANLQNRTTKPLVDAVRAAARE